MLCLRWYVNSILTVFEVKMRRWFDVSTSLFHHIICICTCMIVKVDTSYNFTKIYFTTVDISLQYQLKTHTHTSIHQPISPHPNVFLIENSQSLLLYHNYAIFLPSSQFILRYWYVTSMRPKPC